MPFKEEWEQISEKTRAKLQARGVVQLFPVQAKTYKACYEGKDLIVKSRTGSGKTFAFGIPIVEKLQSDQVFTKERVLLLYIIIIYIVINIGEEQIEQFLFVAIGTNRPATFDMRRNR